MIIVVGVVIELINYQKVLVFSLPISSYIYLALLKTKII